MITNKNYNSFYSKTLKKASTITFTLLFLFLSSCNTPQGHQIEELQCANFRTGNFYLKVNETQYFEITRNDSIQTELLLPERTKYELKINWLDECKFSLTALEKNSKYSYKILIVGITKTKGDTLFYTTYPKGQKLLSKQGTMVKRST